MPLHRLQHSKYANYMQKICKKYAQYATKMCKKMCNQYAEYAQVYVLAYCVYICTPHFADGAQRYLASVWVMFSTHVLKGVWGDRGREGEGYEVQRQSNKALGKSGIRRGDICCSAVMCHTWRQTLWIEECQALGKNAGAATQDVPSYRGILKPLWPADWCHNTWSSIQPERGNVKVE